MANSDFKVIKISANLEIVKLTEHAYMHISYFDSQWGRISSNGLIYLMGSEAFLFDTPMDEPVTMELVNFINDSLKAKVTGFVPNHWHADCIGGLAYLHQKGVESFANKMTIELAIKNGYAAPQKAFTDSLLIHGKIFCFYPGPAHSLDNIVVWIADERILFGGCMVKDIRAKNMGNFADGDLKSWPSTIKKVMEKFPEVQSIIPGHGMPGNFEILKHTYELAKLNAQ